LLADIRAFFAQRQVLEVETPALAHCGVTDVHLHAIEAHGHGIGRGFLQTSPEYAMKRLLAAGVGDCYQLARAFRGDEVGRRHNPEFTLLEWYRVGWDDNRLMAEVDDLLQVVAGAPDAERVSYQSLFVRNLQLDPANVSLEQVQSCAETLASGAPKFDSVDEGLQFLFAVVLEPKLGFDRPLLVTHFPASQAALARLDPDDARWARRFELYWKGVELANGFWELTDAEEQRKRFEEDNRQRLLLGLSPMELDERFLHALEAGLPDCAGVALGIDRLLMVSAGLDSIEACMAFPWDRA
jgi:lysyl-tRNA synthetase class 2